MGTTKFLLHLLGDAAIPGIEELLANVDEIPVLIPEGWVTIKGHHVLVGDDDDARNVLWHGTPDAASHSKHGGLHVGSYEAAQQALEARIGIPVTGTWDGTREYGKTLLAGQATLRKNGREMNLTGYNSDSPQEDHYPTGQAKYSDNTPVPMTAKPEIYPVEIIGKMTNTPSNPHSDTKANALMAGQIKKGTAKKGYYYKNEGEDSGSISAVVPNVSHLKRLNIKRSTNEIAGVQTGVTSVKSLVRDADAGSDVSNYRDANTASKGDFSADEAKKKPIKLLLIRKTLQPTKRMTVGEKPISEDEGHWITRNGAHILVGGDEGGRVSKANLSLVSKMEPGQQGLVNKNGDVLVSNYSHQIMAHNAGWIAKPDLRLLDKFFKNGGIRFAVNDKGSFGYVNIEKNDATTIRNASAILSALPTNEVGFEFLSPTVAGHYSHGSLKTVRAAMRKWLSSQGKSTELVAEADGHWVTINGAHILIGGEDHPMMIGAAIYRNQVSDTVGGVHLLFANHEVVEFEKAIPALAKQYEGVQVDKVERAAGVWQKNREPSFLIEGINHNADTVALDAYAAKLGTSAPERQMAMVRFEQDSKGSGAAYEFHGANIKDEEHAVGVLLKHGFEGQTVPLSTGRIILFDADGSLKGNVASAAKELGLSYSTTPGQVRFIGEHEYKTVQNYYRAAHGQPAEEIHNRHAADLQETKAELQRLSEIVEQLAESIEGEGHWVTINGHPVFLGGEPNANIEKDVIGIAQKNWQVNMLNSDLKVASSYFDRLSQDQLVKAHAVLSTVSHQTGSPDKLLPIVVSRMDDAHAEQALKQATGDYKTATETAIAFYGPAKTAEPIIAAHPNEYPVFSANTSTAARELIDNGMTGQAWSYGPQTRVEYAAENFGPNKGATGLMNYWAVQRGIADTSQPEVLTKTLQTVYDKTQNYYSHSGVKDVTVYRSLQVDPKDPVTPATIVHKPLEAWTTDREQAIEIAGARGIVMTATVPRSSIFYSTDSDPENKNTSPIFREVTVFGGAIKNVKADYAKDIASPAKQKEFRASTRVKTDAEIELADISGPYEQTQNEGWVTINGHHILLGDPEPKLSKEVIAGHNVYSSNIKPRELAPSQTTKEAKTDANGNYDKETQAHHDAVVADMEAGHTPTEGRKPIMWVLGGGPGSGKTSVTADILPHEEAFVVANVDIMKTAIPEGEGLKKTDYLHAGARLLREGQDMNMQLINSATDKHLDITWDSAGLGMTKELLSSIVAKGYDVRLAFVNLPISTAVARAKNRAETSTDPADKDRHIDPERIAQLHYGAAAKFFELKDQPGVTEARLYDNRGKAPKEIFHQTTDEGDTINNAALYAEYKQKAMHLHEIMDIEGAVLAEDECSWITKAGAHICIGGDGVIQKGPEHLIGIKLTADDIARHTTKQGDDSSKSSGEVITGGLKDVVAKLPEMVSGNPNDWNRDEFVNTKLPKDPTIHAFVDAVDGFTNGKYQDLSTIIEKLNTEGEAAAQKIAYQLRTATEASKFVEQAKLLNEAVKISPPHQVMAYRGVGGEQRIDEFENLKAGQELDLAGVKSFSHDKSVAVEFAQKNGGYHYMFHLEGEAKGVHVAALSQLPREQEFITQGKFSVESVEAPSGATKIFHIKQKAIF